MKHSLSVSLTFFLALGCGSKASTVGPGPNEPAPTARGEVVDEPIAHVGAVTIRSTEIAQRFRDRDRAGEKVSPEQILDEMIADTVLAMEGERRGLHEQPAIAESVLLTRYKAAADVLEKKLVDELKVEESTLRALYHELADTVRLHMVVLTTQDAASAARDRLNAGASLVEESKNSLNPKAAARGGDMGTVPRGQLPKELADFAFSAPIGEFGGPIKVGHGWAAVRVTERTVGDPAGFDKKRESLMRHARGQLAGQATYHYAKELRKAQPIDVDQAFLESMGRRVIPKDATEAEHVVATVGGEPLRYRMVLRVMRETLGTQHAGHVSGASVKRQVVDRTIQHMLLGQEAIKRGLGDGPEVVAVVARARAVLLAGEMRKLLAAQAVEPSAADIEAYYRGNQERFRVPLRRECAHIQVADRATADELAKRLASGESFEELAKKHSADTLTGRRGGRLGVFAVDRIDALAKAGDKDMAEALRGPVGGVSAPVKSNVGWHLVKVLREIPAGIRPLSEVRGSIAMQLMGERRKQAVVDGIAALRKQVGPKVDRAALARLLEALESV